MRLWLPIIIAISLTVAGSAHADSPVLRLIPSHQNFGNVGGGTTVTEDIAVLNTSGSDLSIVNASVSYQCGTCPDFPPLFAVLSDCPGTTLASGATCTITVAFTPPADAPPTRYTGDACVQYPDPLDPSTLAETCGTVAGRGT